MKNDDIRFTDEISPERMDTFWPNQQRYIDVRRPTVEYIWVTLTQGHC